MDGPETMENGSAEPGARPAGSPVGPLLARAAREGFLCVLILVAVGTLLIFVGGKLAPDKAVADWPAFFAGVVEEIFLVGLGLAIVLFFRFYQNRSSLIFMDFRWWVIGVVLAILPSRLILPWILTGIVYQLGFAPWPPASRSAGARLRPRKRPAP